MKDAIALVEAYYAAFNAGDVAGMLGLLAEDVLHDICQGGREVGRAAFARFMAHMNRCYAEQVSELVVMAHPHGLRAAAEFVVQGVYLASDPGVPAGTSPARGQGYTLAAGAFFALREGKIVRVSNHYNLQEWIQAVS